MNGLRQLFLINAFMLFGLSLAGCQSQVESATPAVAKVFPRRQDAWVLTCANAKASEPAYLSDGIIGMRFGRDGAGLPNTLLLAKHVNGYGEALAPLPSPLQADWKYDAGPVFSSATTYSQTLDLQIGLLRTHWQESAGNSFLNFICESFILPSQPVAAQRWRIDLPYDRYIEYENPVCPTLSRRLQSSLSETSHHAVTIMKSTLEIPSAYRGSVDEEKGALGWRKDVKIVFGLTDTGVKLPTYEQAFKENCDSWAKLWRTDIEIDGPSEDQQAIRSWLFYLWSSVPSNSDSPVGPMGLSSTIYHGHVFWDSDIWMFPALALTQPKRAETIANYRLLHRPTIGGFPWQSAISGRELAPAEFTKEKHVTGDVAFMLHQAAVLGLVPNEKAKEVGTYAANYFRSISVRSSDGLHELRGVMGPDEFHVGDNDLYTNSLAQWLEDRYNRGRVKYKLPRDSKGLVTFDNDQILNYKQADAALAIYPLQNPEAEKEADQIMRRIAPKTNPNGPAMSDSIHALILARLGKTEKAYQLWKRSWQDFSNHPLNLFSEKRRKSRTYFVTGAAGCLQTVLYGFLGFRIDWKKDPRAVWAKRLHGGDWLSLRPHLPLQWKKVTFRNFPLLGQHYTLVATHSGVTVTQGENP